jgi:hypothetical protein
MTIDNNILTLTFNSARLYSANNHDHLFQLIILIANPYVPPKGRQQLVIKPKSLCLTFPQPMTRRQKCNMP